MLGHITHMEYSICFGGWIVGVGAVVVLACVVSWFKRKGGAN